MSRSRSRSIPQRVDSPSQHSIHNLASSLVGSFQQSSHIAQEALARDLADEGSDCTYNNYGETPFDDDDDDDDDDNDNGYYNNHASAIDLATHHDPIMYRRPSGVAYGTTRPALGPPRPAIMDDTPAVLTRDERVQSRNAELSLLRDNHLLPPKHPVPAHEGWARRVYKRLFSTKVPLPPPGDEEQQPSSLSLSSSSSMPPMSRVVSETSPLLAGSGGGGGGGQGGGNGYYGNGRDDEAQVAGVVDLTEQWDAAVSAGQIKTTWQREAKTIAVYSRSLIVTFLLQYSINVASIFVVGHIGKIELGAVSLATMTANITCSAPFQGLATSLDTLCAQAYGSGHKHLVGLQIQRMVTFLLLLFLPLIVLWSYSTELLALLIPEYRTAELAGTYLKVYLLGVPAFIIFEGGKRFVQAQGLFHATTYVLLVAAPLNVFLNWFFVWHLGWGFVGAPISVVITQNLLPTLLVAYVYFVDGRQCWGGFSRRALTNWGPMIRLSIPGMIMVEAEWFAFEILTLATGQFGSTYLATQSILITITSTTFQLPFPIAIAASTRVANLIGAGLVDAAKTCARVAAAAAVLVGILNVTLLAAFRYQLPRLFTTDEDVIELVASVMPVCAVMQFVDCLAAISHGLLRGTGKQEFGGYANLVCYYVVALPLAFGTAFGLGWKLYGLWFGVSVGLLLVSGVEFLYLYKSDWDKSVKDAERRNANA